MKKTILLLISLALCLSACSNNNSQNIEVETNENIVEETTNQTNYLSEDDIQVNETIENSEDGAHAIEADNEELSYSNILVNKTGESSGDEADFYGENAAIFATNAATLNLDNIVVKTDGTHANGVFSYGENTVVNISNSVIETSGNCSGGIMTTGNGTMNASNLTIHTTDNSSAAIRSDRGGGTVVVNGGSYTTDGKGSPVIYSTADITVNNSLMTSTSSQGVVVEGKNSVTLNDVTLVAENISKNSDKSDYYQAVMIYQSMSGDADEGEAYFTMNGGSLTNLNGDIFFVNNTVAKISLSNALITNEDEEGILLRAQAAGWGKQGSNGGKVYLYLDEETVEGDIYVDKVSGLNMYIDNNSTYTGSIQNENDVYVSITNGSKWILTADSYVSSLTCDVDSIDLNGFNLYVDGVAYTQNTQSTGQEVSFS